MYTLKAKTKPYFQESTLLLHHLCQGDLHKHLVFLPKKYRTFIFSSKKQPLSYLKSFVEEFYLPDIKQD